MQFTEKKFFFIADWLRFKTVQINQKTLFKFGIVKIQFHFVLYNITFNLPLAIGK